VHAEILEEYSGRLSP